MHFPTMNIDQYKAFGESEAFLNLQERISRAAKTNRPVILIGERGTGKELAAARLHYLSQRWGQPYVTINCASLTESLIESELFGHEAGAFTGAVRLRKGRFEIASGGTLFLDEIATLPVTVQEKILRVVEYGQMERVGSSETHRVDVRLVAATNVDLRALAREGKFRQDLLDRLSFEVLVLPPLRRRREDIPLLAEHFARQMAHELGLSYVPAFSGNAMRTMLEYAWPGNVRELKNVVERMVYRAPAKVIDELVFDPFDCGEDVTNGKPGAAQEAAPVEEKPSVPDEPAAARVEPNALDDLERLSMDDAVRKLEVTRLRQALVECRFNQRKAAEKLGLSYHQFRGYFRKYRTELEEGSK